MPGAPAALIGLVLLASSVSSGTGDRSEPLRFELADQYGGRIEYPPAERGAQSVVLIAVSDRRGAEANRQWAERLAERYGSHIEGRAQPRLLILPVAHLDGVPTLLRGIVRSFFRGRNPDGEALIPIGLDWRGDLERQLGLQPGVPNVTVLDADGRVVVQRAGEVTEAGAPVFEALDRLLGPSRSVAGGAR